MNLSNILRLGIALILLASVNAEAYSLHGSRWQTSSVRFYVNPANNDGIPASTVISEIKRGAYAWQNQASISIGLVYGGTTSRAVVSVNGRNDVFFRSIGSDKPLATAYYWSYGTKRVESDIRFNDSHKWFALAAACNNQGFYLANTAVHEFGHFLGVGHSSVKTASMYGTSGRCSKSRMQLDPDDRSAIQRIY